MILPTKHIRPERALLGVGAELLEVLDRPFTMSRLWDEIRSRRSTESSSPVIDYRWFVLALDLLYLIGAIDLERGLICRTNR
jgi:hypothetical protein